MVWLVMVLSAECLESMDQSMTALISIDLMQMQIQCIINRFVSLAGRSQYRSSAGREEGISALILLDIPRDQRCGAMSPNLTGEKNNAYEGSTNDEPVFVVSITDDNGKCGDGGNAVIPYRHEQKGWKRNQYLASLAGMQKYLS